VKAVLCPKKSNPCWTRSDSCWRAKTTDPLCRRTAASDNAKIDVENKSAGWELSFEPILKGGMMLMKILVVNTGSSSIKYQVFNMDDESVLAKGLLDRVGIPGTILEHEPSGKDKVIIKQDIPDHTEGMKLVLDVLVNADYGCVQSLDEFCRIGNNR
jgi:hypothetical protein